MCQNIDTAVNFAGTDGDGNSISVTDGDESQVVLMSRHTIAVQRGFVVYCTTSLTS